MNSVKSLQASQKANDRKKKMPREAAEFAKKLGIDISGMEAEAQDIWKMLENMSENDPLGYAHFMQEHLDREKMEAEEKDRAATANDPKGKFFRPIIGFCVEMQTCGGNDGMKIREINHKTQSGKLLYVNMTSHQALEPPKDQHTGRPISLEGNRSTADGLELPLAIGPVRKHTIKNNNHEGGVTTTTSNDTGMDDISARDSTECLVVDVVVHPYVIHQCSTHLLWLNLTMSLVVEWVEQERRVVIAKNSQGKHIWTAVSRLDSTYRGAKTPKRDIKYMGGIGDNGDVPVLFPVNYTQPNPEEEEQEQARELMKKGGFQNPSDILTHKGRQQEQEENFLASTGKNLSSLLQDRTKGSSSHSGSAGSVATGGGGNIGGNANRDIRLPFDLGPQQPSSGAPASRVPFSQTDDNEKSVPVPVPKPTVSLVQELGPDGTPIVAPPASTSICAGTSAAAGGGGSKARGYAPPTVGTTTATTTATKPTRKAPSIPKGFLNNPKAAGKIYNGESGDRGVTGEEKDERISGAVGGSYARFMDRCQVVNADASGNVTSVQKPKAPAPPPAPLPASTPAPAPAASVSSKATIPVSAPPSVPAPPSLSDRELQQLEEMYERVDDDFEDLTQYTSSKSLNHGSSAANDDFTKQLEQFGLFSGTAGGGLDALLGLDAGGKGTVEEMKREKERRKEREKKEQEAAAAMAAAAAAAAASENSIRIVNSGGGDDLSITSHVEAKWVGRELQIVINDMMPAEAAAVDLQVSTNQVLFAKITDASAGISSEGGIQVEISKSRELVSSSAKAKYSKKSQRMTVAIGTIAAKTKTK